MGLPLVIARVVEMEAPETGLPAHARETVAPVMGSGIIGTPRSYHTETVGGVERKK